MNITVFQALTLLAQKYRKNEEIYPKIKSLYLSGIETTDDKLLLDWLLDDDLLKEHRIQVTRLSINNDPVRRYFESHLCLQTLVISLDALEYDTLNLYYYDVLNLIKKEELWKNYQLWLIKPAPEDEVYQIRMENTEGIRILNRLDSYQSLKPKNMDEDDAMVVLRKRKSKLHLLANISFASWYLAVMIRDLPLNLYDQRRGHYNEVDRGRENRIGQDVKSQTMGIMRSFMALSLDDELFSKQPANYIRPADQTTFVPGAKQPDQGFRSLVTPFSNSISGTLLAQLKVMAQLICIEEFVYSDHNAQLKLYFKNYIAYMIYHSGGHSLDEYTRVFQLPEIQDAFKNVPGFAGLTLNDLFKNENNVAFEEAVNKTILYNQHILNMKQLSMELVQAVKEWHENKKIAALLESKTLNKNTFFHTVKEPAVCSLNRESKSPTSVALNCESPYETTPKNR